MRDRTGRTEVDVRAFRDALGHFASGVVVITGDDGGTPVGFTCQSFTSLSLDPPLVAFCPATTSVSWGRIRPSGRFCVNILAGSQRPVSEVFAERRDDKFDRVAWRPGLTGGPLLDGALAHIECEIESVHAAGDHDVVVGRVLGLTDGGPAEPLLYHRGRYALLAG